MLEVALPAMGAKASDGVWTVGLRSGGVSTNYRFHNIGPLGVFLADNSQAGELGENMGAITWRTSQTTSIRIEAGRCWQDNTVALRGVDTLVAADVLRHTAKTWMADWGYATAGPRLAGPSGLIFGQATWVADWRLIAKPRRLGWGSEGDGSFMMWTLPDRFRKTKAAPEFLSLMVQEIDRVDTLVPIWPRAWPRAQALRWFAASASHPEHRMEWKDGLVHFHDMAIEDGRRVGVISLTEVWSWFHHQDGFESWKQHLLDAAAVHERVRQTQSMRVRWVIGNEELAHYVERLLVRQRSGVEVECRIPDFRD